MAMKVAPATSGEISNILHRISRALTKYSSHRIAKAKKQYKIPITSNTNTTAAKIE